MIDMYSIWQIISHEGMYMNCLVRGVRVLRAELNKKGSRA